MLIQFARPEPYLFTCPDGDHLLVVRVIEASHQAAVSRFRAMSREERRRAAVNHISGPDHTARLASWLGRRLPGVARTLGLGG